LFKKKEKELHSYFSQWVRTHEYYVTVEQVLLKFSLVCFIAKYVIVHVTSSREANFLCVSRNTKFSSVYIIIIWNLTWEAFCTSTPYCWRDVLPPSWWYKHFSSKWCWSGCLEFAFPLRSRVAENVGNRKKWNRRGDRARFEPMVLGGNLFFGNVGFNL